MPQKELRSGHYLTEKVSVLQEKDSMKEPSTATDAKAATSSHHLSDVRFEQLGLEAPLLKAVSDLGFSHCTPIQAQALPLALTGHNVAGQAQTGTGKTAAFLLATLNDLLTIKPIEGRRPNEPRALILAPTRELAVQIYEDGLQLAKYTDLKLGVVFGGTGYEQQRQMLADGVDILIGTTGRIIDYYKQKVFGLDAIDVVVLDEADRMFDLGFIKDIRYLFRRMPPATDRLNMLFSATLSHRVMELAYEHMNNPVKVQVDVEVTSGRIEEKLYYPANDEAIPLLIGLFRDQEPSKAMVFVNTRREAERVWGALAANGIAAGLLTGDVPQKKRLHLLDELKTGKVQALVATDVAARGLHIEAVSHVYNYDLPDDPEDYVHRIGRTARAGATGTAISFANERTAMNLPGIEQYIGYSLPTGHLDEVKMPDHLNPPLQAPRKPGPQRRGGRRPQGNRK